MPRRSMIFNKGSILPSILEMEERLTTDENEALKLAESKVQEAKRAADTLLEDTEKELHAIEENERKSLLEEVDATVDELREREDKDLRELKHRIAQNRDNVLDFILSRVIPGRNGKYPE